MNTRVKGIGPGHYSVQANDGPKTRYAEIGQVWKEGSKWRATHYDDTLPSKKIAVACEIGAFKIAAVTGFTPNVAIIGDAQMDGEEPELLVEEKWPEAAAWPKGTRIRHKEGYTGALEDCHLNSRGRLRYGIRVQHGKAGLYGYAEDYKEVRDES